MSYKVRDINKCFIYKSPRSMFVNAKLNHNLEEAPVEVEENTSVVVHPLR